MDRVIHATDKKSRMFHFSISLPLDARRIYSDEIYDPAEAKRFNACRSLLLFFATKKSSVELSGTYTRWDRISFHSGIITRNNRGSNQDEKVSLLLWRLIHRILWTLQVSITKMMKFERFIDLIWLKRYIYSSRYYSFHMN